ncbi:hypothetical protein ACWDX8_13355 [Streptomyces anthocyanicus]|uniref:hypothetical protein n=1 Tax=Streptomyces TaxID=1883 RepID=UPI001B36303E|nr:MULTISPECIES: hypothetical protein [unclassified Streptomyces]MBQ0947668.1 hypothetical protein [Streptomyces sp. RK76]MDX3405542.1 hypothetical protein [Streptomyces sp. ME02-6977A]
MGLFNRSSASELRAEAAQMEACRDSAARWQEITGTSHLHPDGDMVANYQRKLDEINAELKNR